MGDDRRPPVPSDPEQIPYHWGPSGGEISAESVADDAEPAGAWESGL